MFLEPTETPYDLRFRVGQTPVRVHPFFWLGAVLLGWDFTRGQDGPRAFGLLLLWVACVFISVLLHELGHVWTGRAFGSRAHIVLWGLGGLAIGSSSQQVRWQRILVYLAGPAIQLVLYGILRVVWQWALPHLIERADGAWVIWVVAFFIMMMLINLWWPIFNLLPVWPLDGGRVARELAQAASPRNGTIISLYISATVSGLLAVHCFLMSRENGRGFPILEDYFHGDMFTAIFMAMFCVGNIQEIQQEREQHRPWDDDAPWER